MMSTSSEERMRGIEIKVGIRNIKISITSNLLSPFLTFFYCTPFRPVPHKTGVRVPFQYHFHLFQRIIIEFFLCFFEKEIFKKTKKVEKNSIVLFM